jgi:hypothetical protein
MDYLLYWLDRSGWLAPVQHAWIWASVTAVLAIISLVGIGALARHYDGSDATNSTRP